MPFENSPGAFKAQRTEPAAQCIVFDEPAHCRYDVVNIEWIDHQCRAAGDLGEGTAIRRHGRACPASWLPRREGRNPRQGSENIGAGLAYQSDRRRPRLPIKTTDRRRRLDLPLDVSSIRAVRTENDKRKADLACAIRLDEPSEIFARLDGAAEEKVTARRQTIRERRIALQWRVDSLEGVDDAMWRAAEIGDEIVYERFSDTVTNRSATSAILPIRRAWRRNVIGDSPGFLSGIRS